MQTFPTLIQRDYSSTMFYPQAQRSVAQPHHPNLNRQQTFDKVNVQSNLIKSINSREKFLEKCFRFLIPLQILGVGLLGALTAVSIAIAITAAYLNLMTKPTSNVVATTPSINTLSSTVATTVTTSTTTTSTTTTDTTTTTITTATVSPQSNCTSPCVCAGVSSYSSWQIYSGNGLFMNINTARCNFTRTPEYFTSIVGLNSHSNLIGHSAIYIPTAISFRIYVTSLPGWSSATLLSLSSTNTWDVDWVGMYN